MKFDNVQVKNAMNVAFLCVQNDPSVMKKPVYFKVGYKSDLQETEKNLYVQDGDGAGYPRILVNILEKVVLKNDGFVDLSVNIICASTYQRGENGINENISDVEGYNDMYQLCALFWAYLNGMKHGKSNVKTHCFKMDNLSMENDGYKIVDEILMVEGSFNMSMLKPTNWDCELKNWGVNVPTYLAGKYNPNSDNPFPNWDIEKFKNVR